MPASNAVHAFGTLLQIGDGVTPTEGFATIAEVKSINGPTTQVSTVDVTNHSSGIPWNEFIASLIDPGEVSFEINFIPTEPTQDHLTGLRRDMADRTRRNFKLIWPDTGTTEEEFTAMVTSFQIAAPVDNVLSAQIVLKISGQPSWAL